MTFSPVENALNPDAALTCPYLGMREDPDGFFSYASTGNLCYHCRRPVTPLPAHQEAYCLAGAQTECLAYKQPATKSFPAALRAKEPRHAVWPAAVATALAIALLLAALVFVAMRFFPETFGWRFPVSPPSVAVPAPTDTATMVPSVTATTPPPTNPAASVPTWALAASSITLTPAGTHALEVPIEVDGHELLLHRVGSGETFEIVDTKYGTTAEVIRALNYSIGASLFANTIIVIAPGLQIVDTALPSFLTHRVGDAPAISIDQVATQFNVNAALMRRYNGCTYDCELVSSDWVLIPVVQP